MKSKKNLLLGVSALTIFTLALVFALLDALVPLKIWTHPALNFLFAMFAGFGIMVLIMAFLKKSPWFFFVSAILLGVAGLYVLLQYNIIWWLILIILFVFFAVFALLGFMTAGNQTEDIAINKSSDYKNYEQRKAAEQAKEKEEKPLPEIKSFKD